MLLSVLGSDGPRFAWFLDSLPCVEQRLWNYIRFCYDPRYGVDGLVR